MAENRESTILEVQLDAGKVAQDLSDMIARIAALKEQQKQLTAEIKAGNDVDGKYAAQLIRVKDQLSWTEKQAKGLSATTKLLNADTLTYSDSLNGQRQKLADMQKAYDQMDKAARESEGGKAFLASIKAQSDAVKGLEEETGRAQRNVGNYPKAWMSAIPGMDKAAAAMNALGVNLEDVGTKGTKAFKGLGASVKSFGKLFLTPPIIIIAAIVGGILLVFNKLKEAFKKNDDAGTKLSAALASMKPIVIALQKAFTVLANAIGAVVGVIAKVVNAVGGFFSSLFGMGDAYDAAARAAERLVIAQDKLEDRQREFTVNEAKRNKEIAKLRAEAADAVDGYVKVERERLTLNERAATFERNYLNASKQHQKVMALFYDAYKRFNEVKGDTSKLTEKEIAALKVLRIVDSETAQVRVKSSDLIQQAIDKETENLKEKMEIAKTNLRLMEEQARLDSDTSDETKNKIAQARAEMLNAEEAYYSGVRRLKKEQEREEKELQKARENREKERIAKAEAAARAEADILRQSEDFALSMIKDETAKAIAARQIQGEREIAALQKQLDTDKNLTTQAREMLADLIKSKQEALYTELDQMATDAANAKTEAELQAEQERAKRILEYRKELAETGSAEELELQKELLDLKMQQELDALNLSEEEKFLIRQTFTKKAEELDNEYNANLIKTAKDAKAAYAESLKSTAANASSAFGTMSDLLGQYGEENEQAAAASKAFGIMQIITDQAISIADTAKAITAAVAGATSAAATTGPAAPFVLGGYIAAMVGAVLGAIGSVASTIVQAKQLIGSADAGKFATGGTIPGTSYTGDKLIAHVNSAEGIYTPHQANNILQEIANNPARGGFDYGAQAEALAAAIERMPAPVMDYREFTDFKGRVATFDELAKIG